MSRTACVALAIMALTAPASAQTFRRPVACDGCIANWYYFDGNGADPGVLDWNCGTSTYDGHRGSDFSLAGGNGAINTGYDVVAGADGVVESTQDGHYDHCSTCDAAVDGRCGRAYGFGFGNHIVINHGGVKVIYAHLRSGSVRVAPGATVRCGDVIGQIGSSGCSTGAHVHFETRPLGGAYTTAYDSFAGGCSPTSPTRWTEQGPYRGMPSPACDGTSVPTCPTGTWPIWTCNAARTNRRRCIDGVDTTEACPAGCVSMPVGTDDYCAEPPDGDGDGYRADADCDDADPGRHPGAAEVCDDGVDQDCDGGDLSCPPPPDAGVPSDDAGAIDAGPASIDASVPLLDGGSSRADAAIARPDGGARHSESLVGSCACRAGRAARGPRLDAIAALALLSVLRWRRRRA